MKINEVTSPLKHYLATVRVVINGTGSMARTTISADNQQQARLMLTRLYGSGNVLSISEVVDESSKTYQIHAEAKDSSQLIHRHDCHEKNGSDEASSVTEMGEKTKVLSPSELQVKSLSDKAKQLNQQAKRVKANQSLMKAQEKLRQASFG